MIVLWSDGRDTYTLREAVEDELCEFVNRKDKCRVTQYIQVLTNILLKSWHRSDLPTASSVKWMKGLWDVKQMSHKVQSHLSVTNVLINLL